MRSRIMAALASFAALCFAAPAYAQFTTVSASDTGGAGYLVANATIYWQAVTGFRIGSSGGQALGVPYQAPVTTGAFSLSVPDTSLSDPMYPCYAVTVIDNLTGNTLIGAGLAGDGIHVNTGGAYGCVQPSGSTWSFDSYIPATPPGALVVAGPAGPAGPSGVANWRGAWAATTAYAKDDGYVAAGNGYIVTTAYTSGGSFSSTDTANSVEIAVGCAGTGACASSSVSTGSIKRQLAALISITTFSCGTVTYSGGTYTAAAGKAFPSALVNGQIYVLSFPAINTGAASLTIGSLGTKPIKVQNSAGTMLTLAGGEIVAGPAQVYYDGTEFVYSSPASQSLAVVSAATLTQANFANRDTFYLSAGAETFTLPCSSTLSPNGQVLVFSYSGTITLTTGSGCSPTDAIKTNGTSAASQIIAQGAGLAVITTDGAGNFYVSGTLIPATLAAPTVNAVNMELFPAIWSICDGTCAGGAGANTPSVGPAQTFNVASPSLDNNSTEMTFTANANSTDVLFVSKPAGAYCATCTQFTFDVWYYPTNSSGVTEHEFDEFTDTASGGLWMFGHQCSAGVWDVWNAYTDAWVATSYTCSFAVNTWHHLVFQDSRIAGDTTGCSGYGCMYFNKLTVDGTVVYSMNQSEPAGATPGGWVNGAGAQFQEDVSTASGGSPVAVVSYYDLATFTEAQ